MPLPQYLAVGIVAAALPTAAKACSCIPPTVEQAFSRSHSVFVGTVVGRTAIKWRPPRGIWPAGHSVELAVTEWWKGDGGDRVVVVTGEGGGDCGVSFEVGQSYLVYAYAGHSGEPTTDVCTRTGLLSLSVDDVRELERIQSARSARIVGGIAVLVALVAGVAIGRVSRWRSQRRLAAETSK